MLHMSAAESFQWHYVDTSARVHTTTQIKPDTTELIALIGQQECVGRTTFENGIGQQRQSEGQCGVNFESQVSWSSHE